MTIYLIQGQPHDTNPGVMQCSAVPCGSRAAACIGQPNPTPNACPEGSYHYMVPTVMASSFAIAGQQRRAHAAAGAGGHNGGQVGGRCGHALAVPRPAGGQVSPRHGAARHGVVTSHCYVPILHASVLALTGHQPRGVWVVTARHAAARSVGPAARNRPASIAHACHTPRLGLYLPGWMDR